MDWSEILHTSLNIAAVIETTKSPGPVNEQNDGV